MFIEKKGTDKLEGMLQLLQLLVRAAPDFCHF